MGLLVVKDSKRCESGAPSNKRLHPPPALWRMSLFETTVDGPPRVSRRSLDG